MRICKDLQDFGRGFMRIHQTLGEDLQDFGRGFVRLWERFLRIYGIHENL